MSTSNGKITAPVTILDIAQTIGVASDDLGRLSTSNNVNKWSRYKPIGSTTANDIPQSAYKTYKENGISKPFGLLMQVPVVGEFKTYLQAAMGDAEYLDVDALNRASVWEYAQPQKSSEVIGTIKGKTIYGTVHSYRCRKADFNGYVHRAEPLFNVKWSVIDGSIVCDVRLGSVEGGITLEDMGLNGKVLNLIAVSKNKIAIKYGDKASDNRYVVGINVDNWMDAALYDTTKTYQFVLQAWRIDPILNDMVLFLAVTDTPLRYKLSAESEEDGIYKNPDGFTKDNVYYYPIVYNVQDITGLCVVENSFFEVKMSGGIGNVLWGNKAKNGSYYGIGVPATYDEVVNGETVKRVNYKEYSQMEGYNPANDSYFELDSDNQEFTVKITELGYTESRSALRKFSISNRIGSSSGQYLYEYAIVTDSDVPMRKPLLRDIVMVGGVYKSVSFYIEFEGNTVANLKKKLIARFVSLNGTTKTKVLSEDGALATENYHSITFANIVDVYNNVTGFEVKLNYTDASNNLEITKTKTFNEWLVEVGKHYYPSLTKIRMKSDNETIDNYGDVYFGLPDGVSTSRIAEGTFLASYEVITSDTESSIGV